MTWDDVFALLARIREAGWEPAGWKGQAFHPLPVGTDEQRFTLTVRRTR